MQPSQLKTAGGHHSTPRYLAQNGYTPPAVFGADIFRLEGIDSFYANVKTADVLVRFGSEQGLGGVDWGEPITLSAGTQVSAGTDGELHNFTQFQFQQVTSGATLDYRVFYRGGIV